MRSLQTTAGRRPFIGGGTPEKREVVTGGGLVHEPLSSPVPLPALCHEPLSSPVPRPALCHEPLSSPVPLPALCHEPLSSPVPPPALCRQEQEQAEPEAPRERERTCEQGVGGGLSL